MTTFESSASPQSSMDDDDASNNSHNHRQTQTKPTLSPAAAAANNGRARRRSQPDEEGSFPEEGGGGELWGAFAENFRQVQSVLDRNRLLIQQVNENHRSKIHSNLVKNVALIQEINGNISKVVSLYSDLSSNFSSVFQNRDGVETETMTKKEMSETGEKKRRGALSFLKGS